MALWTPTQWVSGETITAAKANTISGEAATNDRPSTIEDHSSNVTNMRATTDPGESGSESLATNLQGEIERLRYALADLKGTTYWYETPGMVLTTGGTITSTDAGAAAGPTITLYRNSASPADLDLGGDIIFSGEDDGGNQTTYGSITIELSDVTDTTEDGKLLFSTMNAGTLEDTFVVSRNFAQLESLDDGTGANPVFRIRRASATPADDDRLGLIQFSGEDDNGDATIYGTVGGVITDASDASEDGGVVVQALVAGTLTDKLFVDEEGIKDANSRLMQSTLSSRSTVSMASVSSAEITGIRSDTSLITVAFEGVSNDTAVTDDLELVLGDSGGYETTGYVGGDLIRIQSGSVNAASLPGDAFLLADSLEPAGVVNGCLTLCRVTGETWILTGTLADSATGAVYTVTQRQVLTADLDRIKVQTSGGGNWDAGTMAVFAQ